MLKRIASKNFLSGTEKHYHQNVVFPLIHRQYSFFWVRLINQQQQQPSYPYLNSSCLNPCQLIHTSSVHSRLFHLQSKSPSTQNTLLCCSHYYYYNSTAPGLLKNKRDLIPTLDLQTCDYSTKTNIPTDLLNEISNHIASDNQFNTYLASNNFQSPSSSIPSVYHKNNNTNPTPMIHHLRSIFNSMPRHFNQTNNHSNPHLNDDTSSQSHKFFQKTWVPIFNHVKDTHYETNLISFLLLLNDEKRTLQASYLLYHLIIRSNLDFAFILLIDVCVNLLTINKHQECIDLISFWNDTKICNKLQIINIPKPNIKSIPEMSPIETADLLISLLCNSGKSIVASSQSITLHKSQLLSLKSTKKVVHSLLHPDNATAAYSLKALYELNSTLPPSLLFLRSSQKRRLIHLSLGLFKGNSGFPSIINDTYDLARRINGQDIPLDSVCLLIRLNLNYENHSRAVRLYHHLKSSSFYTSDIHDIDLETLAKMIQSFSKTKKYLDISKQIVENIPEEFYKAEGLVEALLSYCGRTRNETLAVKVYQTLDTPIPRSVLTSLLYLHISFDDNSGAEKILTEISRRKDYLKPVEFSMVIQAALNHNNIEKAADLIRNNPNHLTKMSYGSIINAAIEQSRLEIFDEFIQLALSNFPSDSQISNTISHLVIKKINKFEGSDASRQKYLEWKMNEKSLTKVKLPLIKTRIVCLRAILDQAISEKDDQNIRWVLNELRHLGVHTTDILKVLSRRKVLSPNDFKKFFHVEEEIKRKKI